MSTLVDMALKLLLLLHQEFGAAFQEVFKECSSVNKFKAKIKFWYPDFLVGSFSFSAWFLQILVRFARESAETVHFNYFSFIYLFIYLFIYFSTGIFSPGSWVLFFSVVFELALSR